MSNMSYCRFQNTAGDLADCVNAIEEIANNGGTDDYGDTLSHSEYRALVNIIELAGEILDVADEVIELIENSSDGK